MNLHEYQIAAERTMGSETSAEARLINSVLGIAGESAEIAKEMHSQNLGLVLEECGDLLWYIAQLHKACGESIGDTVIRPLNWGEQNAMRELWSLSGMMADTAKKRYFHGKVVSDFQFVSLARGLAQVVYCILKLQGTTVEEACDLNVAKLLKRHPHGFTHATANAKADQA